MSSASNPSWNWLPPRPTTREMTALPAAHDARPCLPAIEPLDDRILLSAAAPTVALKVADGTANTAVLIGLIKGELDLVKMEIDALKFFSGGDAQAKGHSTLKLLTDTFLKLDETLLKIGSAAMVGDVNGYKQETLKLDTVFVKLGELLPKSSELLPAVQRAAQDLAVTLGNLEGGQKVSHEGIKLLGKIGEDFLKIDEALLKFGADPTGAQFKQGLNPAIKIDQEFIKIGALLEQLDPQIKGELTEALTAIKIGTLDYLGSLTGKGGGDNNDGGGGVILTSSGPFVGGVVLPEDAGDDLLA